MIVAIIGRGHSGTSAMSKTLLESGVYMGGILNPTYDLVPEHKMYEASAMLGKHVRYCGNHKWDFSKLHTMPIVPKFQTLVYQYLDSVIKSDATRKGWKLPETTLAYPWIERMFPEAYYIYWIRDPRDCILYCHQTDDIGLFGVPNELTSPRALLVMNQETLLGALKTDNVSRSADSIRRLRAVSWKYQAEIVRKTPPPDNFIAIRFEDFVLNQDQTLKKLEEFLGIPLKKIEINKQAVGRWKNDKGQHYFSFLEEDLERWGYKR